MTNYSCFMKGLSFNILTYYIYITCVGNNFVTPDTRLVLKKMFLSRYSIFDSALILSSISIYVILKVFCLQHFFVSLENHMILTSFVYLKNIFHNTQNRSYLGTV